MSDSTVQIEPALLQRMVRFIKGAGTRLEQMAADREQAKEAAPKVVDTLIKQGLIGAEQKEAATEALAESHERTMETLRRTATHAKASGEQVPQSMGTPADDQTKTASASTGSEARQEADRAFLAAFGFSRD